MKQEMIQGILALLLLQAPVPNSKAVVEGLVVRGDTGAAVAGAQITLSVSDTPDVFVRALSNAEGRFTIKDINPGTYRLFAARNGFARAEHGQRTPSSRGTPISIAAGQTLKDFSLRLTPAGVITGRVTDSAGDPLTGFSVELIRPEYNSAGRRVLLPFLSAKTDDRGEYRIFWVTPGKYYVSVNPGAYGEDEILKATRAVETFRQANRDAGLPPGSRPILELASLANVNQAILRENYLLTYYPGTTDAGRAQQVDVKAGNEIGGIDVQLVRQPLARVRGRVYETTGQPTESGEVTLRANEGSRFSSPIASDSTFEIRSVPPGIYTIDASGDKGHAISRVEVVGTDIDNLVLTRRPGTLVSGLLRANGVALNQGLSIALADSANSAAQYEARVDANGTFTFESVDPGRYWVKLENTSPSFFLQEARTAGTDLLRETLIISDTTPTVLDLTLSNKPGRVEGMVTDQLSHPVGGVEIVLIPNELRTRSHYYRTATTDAAGLFQVENVIPGDYKAFSWEELEPYSYYEPDIMKKFEQAGSAVRVSESASSTVNIKLIPANNP